VALDEHVGERVRVGGLVAGLESDGFRLDDGTAVGRVVLEGGAAGQLASLSPGDALGVVGMAERRVAGGRTETVVIVEDPAAVLRAGDPVPDPSTGLDPASSPAVGGGDPATTGSQTADLVDPAVPEVGAAGIALIGLASLAVTLLRRRRSRRRLAATVAARLDALDGARRPALATAEAKAAAAPALPLTSATPPDAARQA
jgi:hypothetical protein